MARKTLTQRIEALEERVEDLVVRLGNGAAKTDVALTIAFGLLIGTILIAVMLVIATSG